MLSVLVAASACYLRRTCTKRLCLGLLPAQILVRTLFSLLSVCLSVCLSVGRMTQSHCCICTNWGTMCIREEPTNDYLCVESVWNNIQDILAYIY